MKKVLHILSSGSTGGIEIMLEKYAARSMNENIFVFVWDEGPSTIKIKELGCQTFFLNCHSVGIRRAIIKLINIVKDVNPDFVISHHGNGFVRLLGEIARVISREKINAVYVHSNAQDQLYHNSGIKGKIMNSMTRYSFMFATSFVAISESVKESLIDNLGIKAKKIVTIYNGVDIEKYSLIPHTFDGIVHFVFVGRLIENKGVQIALQALSQLPADIIWDFTIAGDGTYRETLESLASELNISSQVNFIGTSHDVPEILKKSDVFIHSCLWKEGFGISVAEAMAAGKICIGSKIGAIPELIIDGENGYLCEANNPIALKEIIEQVVSLKENWLIVQQNAIESVKKYSVDVFTENLDQYINRI